MRWENRIRHAVHGMRVWEWDVVYNIGTSFHWNKQQLWYSQKSTAAVLLQMWQKVLSCGL